MTNEEPLLKKVSSLSQSNLIIRVPFRQHGLFIRLYFPFMSLQVRLSESDMKTLTREELCTRCVAILLRCYL